jgi:hypothetical protein
MAVFPAIGDQRCSQSALPVHVLAEDQPDEDEIAAVCWPLSSALHPARVNSSLVNIDFISSDTQSMTTISRYTPLLYRQTVRRTTQIHQQLSQPRFLATMAPLTSWDRLVRYVSAKDGKIRYGEPIVSDSKPDIDQLAQDGKLEVNVLEGPTPVEAKATGEKDSVKQLLGPLTPKDVPIIRCVGLNYKTHSKPI